MAKPTYILQDWSIRVARQSDYPYTAPECLPYWLEGKVYGREDFPDGELIRTSNIINQVDEETYETRNSIYKVGRKDSNYVQFLKEIGYREDVY